MTKLVYVCALVILVFCTSCGGQKKTDLPKEKIKYETKDVSTSRWIDTKYEYTDSIGKSLIIQNSFPRGGTKYTDPDGEVYFYVVFFTRIINETANPLELKINFPVDLDSYELPSLPGKYFLILLPSDTIKLDKEPLFNYGLPDLESFLDNNRHKSSSLNRTINPRESSGFYVVKLNKRPKSGWQGKGSTRAGFSLKEQNLFYRIKNDGSKSNSKSSDKEIHVGSINLKNLMLKN